MKPFFVASITLCSLSLLGAKDPAMKNAKTEGTHLAQEQLPLLQEFLLGKSVLGASANDLLSTEDKGKQFDAHTANQDLKNANPLAASSETYQFLQTVKKPEKLEGSEEFLAKSNPIVQSPQADAGILSIDNAIIPEEEILRTCQEGGSYQVAFTQSLTVQVTPEVKQTIHQCKGHRKTYEYFWGSDAYKKYESLNKEFSGDSSIKNLSIISDGGLFSDYQVVAKWTHVDNASACNSYNVKEVVAEHAREADLWETHNPAGLADVESNPSCRLLYHTVMQGPDIRIINGQPVSRDAWARQLYFSCEPSANSPCAQLRAQGGVIVSKKCLQQNPLNECELWEKTYDLGKRGAFQQTTVSFKEKELWGLNSAFDTSHEKNADFGSTLTTLSVFADMENELQQQGGDFQDKVKIFNGEVSHCQKSFLEGNVFDCCQKMTGGAVTVKLARCTTEEKCLAKNREDGKCHYVGSHKINLGTVTQDTYCCFPTKLARVVQEQGRQQLHKGWGSADAPKCRGFSLQQLKQINFSTLDLSEVIDEIQVDKQAYEKKLKETMEALQPKVQAEIERKRLESSDKPFKTEILNETIQEKND